MKEWRGISTTTEKINEGKPITKINRFGQKTISLPRITDDKRWAGYPGITGISRRLAKLIPECKFYVEPFAGTAKVFQELAISRFQYGILNDKSKFVYNWLKKEFPLANVTNDDFIECMGYYNNHDTVYVIDQPWNKSYYDQKFSCFDRPSVQDYDKQVIAICGFLKGKFFITTRKENKVMLESPFNNYLIESEYVVCGKYPKTLITTNMELPLDRI